MILPMMVGCAIISKLIHYLLFDNLCQMLIPFLSLFQILGIKFKFQEIVTYSKVTSIAPSWHLQFNLN